MHKKLEDLRDQFATMALCGLLSDPERKGDFDDYARDAYALADAMMVEREAKGKEQ